MDRDRSVTVLGMPDNEMDPAGNTQQFRAFVQQGTGEPAAKGGNTGLIVGVVAAVVVGAVLQAPPAPADRREGPVHLVALVDEAWVVTGPVPDLHTVLVRHGAAGRD